MRSLFSLLGVVWFIGLGCSEPDWQYLEAQMFKVKEVVSGNRLLLGPGYEVVLLGVNASPKAKEYLEQHLLNEDVRLVLESKKKMQFSMVDRPFYAYVLSYSSPESINGKLLKEGYAALEFTNMSDSLNRFANYFHDSPIQHIRVRTGDISTTEKKLILTSEKVQEHVHKVLTQLTKDRPVKGDTKYQQMCALWKHLYDNWYYIHDPSDTPLDTWRTSEESVNLFYSNGGKQYSGDCDDFAIMAAAMVRCVGLSSRFIAASGFNGGKGHAYAEVFVDGMEWESAQREIRSYFNLEPTTTIFNKKGTYENRPGFWINLDWWSPHIGSGYYPGVREAVLEDL